MFNLFSSKTNTITPKEAHERLQKEKDIVLLDVRTPEEYLEKRIPGSVNIPLNLLAQVEKKIPDKNKIIFVYCLSGSRSNTAAKILDKFGYTNVHNLGGIRDWSYETVSGK